MDINSILTAADKGSQAGANIVSAIAGLFPNGYSRPLSKKAQSTFVLYNELAREQEKKNLEEITKPYYNWQKINDARLTIAGLKAAGINPLMAYGGIGQALGADSLFAQSSATDPASIASSGSAITQNQMAAGPLVAQTAKTLAETESIKQNIEKTKAETEQQKTFNQFAKDIYRGQRDIQFANLKLTNAQVITERLSAKEKIAEIRKLYKECNRIDAEIGNINSQTRVFNQQVELLKTQRKLTEKQIDALESDIALKAAQTARTWFGINVDRAQIANFQASARMLLEQGSMLGFANQYNDFVFNSSWRKGKYFESKFQSEMAGFQFQIDETANHGFNVGWNIGDVDRVRQYTKDDIFGFSQRFTKSLGQFTSSLLPMLK